MKLVLCTPGKIAFYTGYHINWLAKEVRPYALMEGPNGPVTENRKKGERHAPHPAGG